MTCSTYSISGMKIFLLLFGHFSLFKLRIWWIFADWRLARAILSQLEWHLALVIMQYAHKCCKKCFFLFSKWRFFIIHPIPNRFVPCFFSPSLGAFFCTDDALPSIYLTAFIDFKASHACLNEIFATSIGLSYLLIFFSSASGTPSSITLGAQVVCLCVQCHP